MAHDLEAGVDQEEPEEHKHDREPGDDRGSEDEDGSKKECAEDAPEQHPVLILERDLHRGKQQCPDEHVVDAERLLGQVDTQILAGGGATKLRPHEERERQATQDPEGRFARCFTKGGLMSFAVAVEIDGKQRDDRNEEHDPVPAAYLVPEIDKVVASVTFDEGQEVRYCNHRIIPIR